MPKKGQGSRGTAPKKPPPSPATTADNSFIVFTNDRSKPKTENAQRKNAAENNTKAAASGPGSASGPVGGSSADASEDVQKKPDTRTLIGGASWTGKLPMNMLSEHCQKQRWAKPEYTMVRHPSVWPPA